MDEALLQAFQRGDRRALARLLTLASRGRGDEFVHRLPVPSKQSRIVVFIGSGGVGKSTLIGKLIEHIRKQSQSVAVLACDPQSPLSGGALLGDRFRMPSLPQDDGVFIRSIATEPGHGAVTEHLPTMMKLVGSFGFEVVLIETVGAGQGDTAVREIADVFVLLLQPETGDDIQWEKAGVLEVADIIVVHKADLPGAESAAAQVRAALDLADESAVPVLKVSSRSGDGIAALWEAIAKLPLRPRERSSDVDALLGFAQAELKHRFSRAASDPRVKALLHEWRCGALDLNEAGKSLLRLLCDPPSGDW
jgi:LAO/AO transport system ATPase